MRNTLGSLLDLLFVPRCAICRTRLKDSTIGLCSLCYEKYEDEKSKYCDFCGMEAHICACQPHLTLINGCSDYRKLVFYPKGNKQSIVRGIVYSVKRRHNLPLAEFVASEIASIDKGRCFDNTIVTFCPRTTRNKKKYGYDQAEVIADFYAKKVGLELKQVLKRNVFHKSSEQKLLNFRQRAANMRGAYKVKNAEAVIGKTVILVDDVVTSGATVGECISLLYSAGAKDVICRSFAYTYRKNKSKKD